jgi:hypothetical protein
MDRCLAFGADLDRRDENQMRQLLWAFVLISTLSLTGCCGCPESDAFARASLDQKIAMWQSNKQKGCICAEGAEYAYLTSIAHHGAPAVSAMIPYLERDQPDLSVREAMLVVVEASNRASTLGKRYPHCVNLSHVAVAKRYANSRQ